MPNALTLFANSAAGSMQSEQLCDLWHELVPAECRGQTFFKDPNSDFNTTLKQALTDCEHRNSILMVAGGDGTVSSVVNIIAGTDRAFGVLPQGTFNFFARSYGIPLDPRPALEFALHAQATSIPLAYLNDRAFLVNVGLGLYPRVIAAREAHQQYSGRSSMSAIVSGVWTFLWTLLRERHVSHAHLQYDGQDQRLLTPLLMISHNREQLYRLDPRFSLGPERLAVLRMRSVSTLGLLKLLANGLAGRLLDEDRMACFAVNEICVRMRKKSVRVAIDGELAKMPLPLNFKVVPDAIRCLLQNRA